MIKYVRPFLDLSPARLPQDLRSCRRAIEELFFTSDTAIIFCLSNLQVGAG